MLENNGGLDMTMVQSHAVVPIVLSETNLEDPWEIWRTAFRETAKLLYYNKENANIDSEFRLHKWLLGNQKHPWFARGANDAKNYFESVDGDIAWLMLANEWDWLQKKFNNLYNTDFNKPII